MTPKQAAALSGMPHEVIISALHSGRLAGKKYRKRWHIKPAKAYRFGRINSEALDALSKEYVSLYWQGRTIQWLQNHVKEDFEANHISWPVAGFAEQTIYASIMREAHNGR